MQRHAGLVSKCTEAAPRSSSTMMLSTTLQGTSRVIASTHSRKRHRYVLVLSSMLASFVCGRSALIDRTKPPSCSSSGW